MKWLKAFLMGSLLSSSFCAAAEQKYTVPPMVTIPAGTFTMGSDTGEPVQIPHHPAHKVSIKSFQFGKHEVTVKEFRQFVEDTKHKAATECWKRKHGTDEIDMVPGSWDSPQYAPSEFHPVMCVGTDDALAYMAWLSKKTGKKYRLPSEAEWEYAARAGSKDNYFFGNDEKKLCEYANTFDKSGERAFKRDLNLDRKGVDCDDHAEYTAMVGSYKPNAFGLYDMIGNVGEYVEDCQHANYTGAPSDGSAWIANCEERKFQHGEMTFTIEFIIHRGGNYGGDAAWNRIFIRGHAGKTNPSSLGEGFRIAADLTDETTATPKEHRKNTKAFLAELAIAQKAVAKKRAVK